MAYRKILLALDMKDKGTVLFEEALDLAHKLGAELALLCCFEQETVGEAEDRVTTISELDMSGSQRIHDKQRRDQLEHVSAWLESLVGIASERGVPARADAEEGKPAQRICEMAVHWGADLIMLGHSSRHPFKELLIGNMNSHVLRHAPCAVLITKSL
jgi:nucleotide-binding universal stress UspA family protein